MIIKCTKCKIEKELNYENFRKHKLGKHGFHTQCRKCQLLEAKKYGKTEKGILNNRNARWKAYGIRNKDGSCFKNEDFNKLLNNQNKMCAICFGTNPGPKNWHVDHNHKTGVARGLLCQNCNHMIGHSIDNIDILMAGANYLKQHSGQTSVISVK